MARFILIAAVAGAPPNAPYTKYPRGTTIANSTFAAQPGDVVWPALANAASPVNMRPLDAEASAQMGLPIMTKAQLAVSSVGGAAGENAGV